MMAIFVDKILWCSLLRERIAIVTPDAEDQQIRRVGSATDLDRAGYA
jgi:hypothetical protein